MVKVVDKDRQGRSDVLHFLAWQWASAAVAGGSRRCGWPVRICRAARAIRFYERLNRVLDATGFDAFVEEQCAKFYADGVGRPSLAPGRYFRMLLLGYFEGLDSERAIAWRAADSLSLRQLLDVSLDEAPPDHSTVSRTRRRIDVETHLAVFTWVLQQLAEAGLIRGKTVGIDATTLEANAALRSIVRRGYGRGLRDVPAPTGGGVGHRHADARRTGPNGPQAPEEGVQ